MSARNYLNIRVVPGLRDDLILVVSEATVKAALDGYPPPTSLREVAERVAANRGAVVIKL